MKNVFFNNKRIAILLLVVVTMLTIFTITLVVKNKNSKKYQSKATYTEIVDTTNTTTEVKNENEDVTPEELNPEDTSWDEDAEETKVEKTEEIKKDNSVQYYLKINYIANVVTAYTKDSEGNYTNPVKAMVCSTGTATPHSGTYRMSSKYRWHMLNGGVYGQYCSRITGHILFHSVPYATNSPDTLKYVAYDKLGTKASAGCIRLTVADAMWVYSNCASGTYVEFYGSSDPGPLGKPSARKISSNEACRNWDPTDPDSRNPWNNYVEPKNENTKLKNKEENNNITNKETNNGENTVIEANQTQEKDNIAQNNTSEENENNTVNEITNDENSNTTNSTTNSTTNETTEDNSNELENNTQSNNENEI